MRFVAIVIGLSALPALAAAQQAEGEAGVEAEGGVVFVDSSEVEIVVDENGDPVQPPPPTLTAQPGPPPPPATGQVMVPAPPQVQLQPQSDRQLLRARLAEYPLGGPIAMLAVGIPIAAIFTLAAYYAWQTEDFVECFDGACGDEEPNRTATTVLGVIAGVGLVIGVIGLIRLIVRAGQRGKVRREFSRGNLTFDPALIRF